MKRLLALVAILFAVWWFFLRDDPEPPPGTRIETAPVQQEVTQASWRHLDAEIVPLAHYHLTARVLSKKRYRWDDPAALAPIDLALGWKGMSDTAVLKHVSLSQGGRWYEYSYDGDCPLPPDQVAAQSANVHCLPADDAIFAELQSLRRNSVVELSGYLVEVRRPGRPPWRSSLTRTDAGNGACEIFWIESARRVNP